MSRWLRVTLVVCTLWSATEASAHESRPLYVEIIEIEPSVFRVRWKTPPTVQAGNEPTVALPDSCSPVAGSDASSSATSRTYRCSADPSGEPLRIEYRLFNPSVSTLVRVRWRSGQTHSLLGAPEETSIDLPDRESFGTVASDYLSLGARHILEGYDHLLFLVCLLAVAGTGRRILITVTGFTLAHSLTLALSTLDVVRIPTAPVEATIALSIVFLAVEIARGDTRSLTYRYPITVASTFGLLHGFGFAAMLGETGLPQTAIPAALLFFNLGVELGQIAFVVAIVLIFQLARRIEPKRAIWRGDLRSVEVPTAYIVGSWSSFWMIERVAGFWAT